MGRKQLTKLDPWFERWFQAMPEPWQKGLLKALEGESIFRGDLLRRTGEANLVVFFVPAALADDVEARITGKAPPK